jgi:hypothetical protein
MGLFQNGKLEYGLNKLYYNGTCQNKGAAKEKCLDIDP